MTSSAAEAGTGAEDVVDLLAARAAGGSLPGQRTDGARLVLLIEGGSARGAISNGMALVIEELDLLDCFDAVYGSSAGALNGAWLLCRRAGRNIQGWWHPEVMPKVINPRRALLGRPVVDTRYLVHHVYEHVTPMGFTEILDSAVTFHPLATDARTGASTDLHPLITDVTRLQLALRATTCLPVLAGRPVSFGADSYVDAGVSESVPIHTAVAQGATHIVALRSRRPELVRPPSRMERRVVGRYLARHAPGALDPWMNRRERRADEERALAEHPAVLQVLPPQETPVIGRIERDPDVMRRAVACGHAASLAALRRAAKSGHSTQARSEDQAVQ